MELVDVPLRDKDIKAKAIIYCPSAPDAVATYYHMKALRHTYPKQFGSRWYHVCFPYGAVPFSPVHYNKMHRFADNIILPECVCGACSTTSNLGPLISTCLCPG